MCSEKRLSIPEGAINLRNDLFVQAAAVPVQKARHRRRTWPLPGRTPWDSSFRKRTEVHRVRNPFGQPFVSSLHVIDARDSCTPRLYPCGPTTEWLRPIPMPCSRKKRVGCLPVSRRGPHALVVGSEERLEAFQRNRVVVLHSRDRFLIRLNFRAQAPKGVLRKFAVLSIFSPLLAHERKEHA